MKRSDNNNKNNAISNKGGDHPLSRKARKIDRKIAERNRRIRMKGLCFELTSLIPHHHTRSCHLSSSSKFHEIPSQQDQLQQATTYIKQLKERIDELKIRKEELLSVYTTSNNVDGSTGTSANNNTSISREVRLGFPLPAFEIRDTSSGVEVVLISGKNSEKKLMLSEVIAVLEEEGAEVVGASFTVTGDSIFHTLHAQERLSRIGIETSRVRERLKELIN